MSQEFLQLSIVINERSATIDSSCFPAFCSGYSWENFQLKKVASLDVDCLVSYDVFLL